MFRGKKLEEYLAAVFISYMLKLGKKAPHLTKFGFYKAGYKQAMRDFEQKK